MSNLYLLTPPHGNYLNRMPELLATGVDILQYRRPDNPDRAKLEELNRLRKLTRLHGVELVVNDRPDLAIAAGAEAVHLGREDLPVNKVKENWPELDVGATQRAGKPLVSGADYLGVGPVFQPGSKRLDLEPCGWAGVEEILAETDKPVYAIGGIGIDRLEGMPNGLAGVAVIGAVWEAPEPVRAVERLKDQIGADGGK